MSTDLNNIIHKYTHKASVEVGAAAVQVLPDAQSEYSSIDHNL